MAGLTGQGMEIASTVLKAGGSLYGGVQAKRAADSEAEQLRKKASVRRGESQIAAADEKRQAKLLQSRALAVAAAGGGGVSDPTVINAMGDLGAEGEYRALSRLYEGETDAQGLEDVANARKKEGRASMISGALGAGSSVLTGVTTLRTKYGSGP